MAPVLNSIEPRIEHVVVLMLENRSFDHMLGFLRHPDPTFNGLRDGGYRNVSAAGVVVPATSDGDPSDAAPDHSHAGVLEQIAGYGDVPTNGGFVRSYATASGDAAAGAQVMRCLDPDARLPVLAQLAREFAVCDKWFSSVPGETWPNRNFVHAATSDGAADIEVGFYYDRTIFELLESRGGTWRIYHDGMAQAWCFRNLWRQQVTWLDRLLGRKLTIGNWYLQPAFYDHVQAGDLPQYAFIEPAHMAMPGESRATNSQHPDNNRQGPVDFYAGEQLISCVYGALRDNPALFAKTLLLITYDEHGGFYDHVSPPAATPPGGRVWRSVSRQIGDLIRDLLTRFRGKVPPKRDDFAFDRLGVRVPAVLVSPWIKPGTILHTQLEHASVAATLRALFAPGLSSLTARDEHANTFHGVVREHGLEVPRQHARVAIDTADAPTSIPVGSSLPDVSATIVPMTPPSDQDVGGPRSKLNQQLVDLGQQVRTELRREGTSTGADKARPTVAGSEADATDAAAVAPIADEFADAARTAREREGR